MSNYYQAMSLWLVTAYFPAHIAAGSFAPRTKRIPPNNFDLSRGKLMALAQWDIARLMDLSSAVLTSTFHGKKTQVLMINSMYLHSHKSRYFLTK